MAATARPDLLDAIYAEASKVVVEPAESIEDALVRLRASIAESRASTRVLRRRDEILEALTDEFRCKVTAIALKKHPNGMARPVEIDAFLYDLANNLAQGLADEHEVLAEREAELQAVALEPDEDATTVVDDPDSNESLGLSLGVQRP